MTQKKAGSRDILRQTPRVSHLAAKTGQGSGASGRRGWCLWWYRLRRVRQGTGRLGHIATGGDERLLGHVRGQKELIRLFVSVLKSAEVQSRTSAWISACLSFTP